MSEHSVISLKNVDVHHYDHQVLFEVNLEIHSGEFVFMIGQTGSGKSSLLRTIYGDLSITEGQGNVAGFDLNTTKDSEIPFLRRKLGIVFQDFQLLTDRTTGKNLEFVMHATGWENELSIKQRIEDVMALVGLENKSHKMPHELSGGEQQRVVIARALVNYPEIILADEPTGNLDPDTSVEIMQLLKEICRNGTAVLMATHDYRMIERFPSRIIRCENGKIIEEKFEIENLQI